MVSSPQRVALITGTCLLMAAAIFVLALSGFNPWIAVISGVWWGSRGVDKWTRPTDWYVGLHLPLPLLAGPWVCSRSALGNSRLPLFPNTRCAFTPHLAPKLPTFTLAPN